MVLSHGVSMSHAINCRQTCTIKIAPKWTSQGRDHFSQVKRSCLLAMIGRFQSSLFASVFQSLLPVVVIMTDGSEKGNC